MGVETPGAGLGRSTGPMEIDTGLTGHLLQIVAAAHARHAETPGSGSARGTGLMNTRIVAALAGRFLQSVAVARHAGNEPKQHHRLPSSRMP